MTETTTPTRPDASVMNGVIPYVGYGGRANEAADFYVRAFGAIDLGRMADGEQPDRLMHAQVEINGGCLMMSDMSHEEGGEPGRLTRAHMQLVVADGHAWWNRALAAGCTEVMPYERQFWGDDWGLVEDPFGIRWAILQPAPEPVEQEPAQASSSAGADHRNGQGGST